MIMNLVPSNKFSRVLDLAGHLNLAGFYFFKCPLMIERNIMALPGLEHGAPLIGS